MSSIRANPADWTGLPSDEGAGDVRKPQNPVPGGPKPREPVVFETRVITPQAVFTLIMLGLAAGITALFGFSDVTRFLLICFALFALWSFVSWRGQRRSGKGAVQLDASGLSIVGATAEPIPWSRIGRIDRVDGALLNMLRVALDPDYETQQVYPWPISLIAPESFGLALPATIISMSPLRADSETVIAQLTRFRDNYCGSEAA